MRTGAGKVVSMEDGKMGGIQAPLGKLGDGDLVYKLQLV